MTYLKYYAVYFYYLVKTNIAKTIFIILAIIGLNFAGTYDDVKCGADISEELIIDNQYLYISKEISESSINFEILQFDEPQELKDGKLIWYEYSNWNIFWWALVIISSIIVVVSTFMDEDTGWDLSYVKRRTLRFFPYTLEENGTYYYMVFNRLIGKRDYQVHRDNVIREFGITSLSDVLYCPEYNTKQEKRENKLDKLGIK